MSGRVRHVPTRSCVACRTPRPKRELLRIVRTPAGEIALDPGGRMTGRGAYVCPGTDCLRLALARGALSRALEIPVAPEARAALLAAVTDIQQGGARGQE